MQFLKAFINDPIGIGAISPSSEVLAKAMLDDLSIAPGEAVLELGPGTGAFTTYIRQMIADSSDYLGVEREPKFARILSKRFPDLRVVNGSAEGVYEIYKGNGLRHPKAIVSGLPVSTQPRMVLDSIIEILDRLMAEGSVFRTFQYVHAFPLPSAVHFRRRMDGIFGSHQRSRVVIRNLPPAVVLTWRRRRAS